MLEAVRRHCAAIAESGRWVTIDLTAAAGISAVPAEPPEPGPAPGPMTSTEERAAFWLTLDTINFGSGWFPTLRKRPGRSSYF